ncbi:M48 family metallopeptidase [Aquihabitans sp. G128]|uniref:M48 metallopeptidase family protein n=1 Tax=Aquihabitans sp. G128 TaxID=2849779 RepID=UPI001C24ADFE|nr:M48 family metallopeptidase [Aquihabitans sp. G128]QXC60125.1 M48 family metallopeptidase [Aquihabitans sp. G128]
MLEVTVVRSAKRRKTAQARLVDGVLEVRIPARASRAEEARLVEGFRKRFERSSAGAGVDLAQRARRLAEVHGLPRPDEIRWVSNQAHRWGSCTPSTRTIRISDRLADHPTWVIDHVVVHELAHLVEPGHGPRFQALVARYPLAERAEGYLLALSGGVDPHADPLADDLDEEPPPIALPADSADLRRAPRRPGAAGRSADVGPATVVQLPLDL